MILIIPMLLLGMVNTMASLKYETENSGDCISLISGQNLCLAITTLKCLVVFCTLAIIGMVLFRKRIVNR